MSTAILISGQLRTFSKCYPTQRWHLLRHFADCHFFITVQDNCDAGDIDILRQDWGDDHVHFQALTDPDLTPELTPELSRAYHQAPYTNAAPAHQLLLQHWYQNEVWKTFKTFENARTQDSESSDVSRSSASSPVFDTIIRLRADLWFHSFEDPRDLYPNRLGIRCFKSIAVRENEAFTPWWGKFGGLNDRLAIMGPTAARAYFETYQHIPELLAAGCPFHPETLVAASLERSNIDHHPTLKTEFSTMRVPGDPRGEQRFPEIAPWDIAHAALRAA